MKERPEGAPLFTYRYMEGAKNNLAKTMMKELEEMGLLWDEAQDKARDRVQWRGMIADLCSSRHEED